jgi:aspartate racemase
MIVAKDRILELTLEQRTALEKRLLGRRGTAPATAKKEGPQLLSPAQEGLWLLHQLVPNSPLYNIPQAFRLRGPLNLPALEESFQTVVRRQEALRTRFILVDHQPRQTALDSIDFRVHFEDLSHLAAEEREMVLACRLAEEARAPFDLGTDLLIRARVIKTAPEEHILAVTVHHIVADNWSLGLLFQEVSAFYAGAVRGEIAALGPVCARFADWTGAKAGVEADDIAFWRGRLAGRLPELQLPSDHPRPARQSFQGGWRPMTVPANVTAELKRLSQSRQATLYMTLLAAFSALLHRYTAEETILLGCPVSRRDQPGAEGVIGMLVNTIPARVELAGDPSFVELLERVRKEVLECHRHSRTPFEKVLEGLRLSRHGARHPVFQTIFQWVNASAAALSLPGIRAEELPLQTGTAKFDLTVTLLEDKNGLRGNIEFSSDLFEAETIDRLAGHYNVLLEAITRQPLAPISDLPLMSPAERHKVVVEWNQTTTEYPRDQTIDEVFEEQARRAPGSVALVCGGQTMTYSELNRRASEIASFLQRAGVKAGGNVAICLERSFDLIAGLLGILKAGAAYVPLDSSFPPSRLEYMKRDSGAALVLTQETVEAARREGGTAVAVPHKADDPAYIIYTSGSTGEPKGVVVPHRGVVRLVKNSNYASFGPEEVFLQFAPVTFDASTFEIWGALLNGARLVIYPPRFESLDEFAGILREHRVSTLWLTAGLFHQIVDHQLDCLGGVRQLLAGGDVLSVPHVKKMLQSLGCRLINGYGPTENTTFSCTYTLPKSWNGASVPIGRPIANSQAYILDKKLNPVPVGVAGELCAGGDGVALGYLNSPDLTAARFVPNPFGPPGARLYRTGDIARFQPDGVIEFLGRADQQVKIRGFRVELGEVEQALAAHPGVRQAVVVARADASFTKHLAAYCAVLPEQKIAAGELRDFLRRLLPEYMIPSDFVFVENFPLTANGKVDRQRLPAPGRTAGGEMPGGEPRNETERKLAQIWREVLGLKTVGIHENFFELGGHSLLAMRVLSRVESVLGASVPLREIFEQPTVAALAGMVLRSDCAPGAATEIIPRRRRKEAAVVT